ncbi:hypothetical protein K440DRAFT_533595, partial [Wilcoxina mikolae CBS 423.85]
RASDTLIVPLEDQYQKEAYRCMFALLEGGLHISPEFIVQNENRDGRIDFQLANKKWAVELVREGDDMPGHLGRFGVGGNYHSMITSGEIEQYAVFNFTTKVVRKKRPGPLGALHHASFSNNYRIVNILDANLELEETFSLLENEV